MFAFSNADRSPANRVAVMCAAAFAALLMLLTPPYVSSSAFGQDNPLVTPAAPSKAEPSSAALGLLNQAVAARQANLKMETDTKTYERLVKGFKAADARGESAGALGGRPELEDQAQIVQEINARLVEKRQKRAEVLGTVNQALSADVSRAEAAWATLQQRSLIQGEDGPPNQTVSAVKSSIPIAGAVLLVLGSALWYRGYVRRVADRARIRRGEGWRRIAGWLPLTATVAGLGLLGTWGSMAAAEWTAGPDVPESEVRKELRGLQDQQKTLKPRHAAALANWKAFKEEAARRRLGPILRLMSPEQAKRFKDQETKAIEDAAKAHLASGWLAALSNDGARLAARVSVTAPQPGSRVMSGLRLGGLLVAPLIAAVLIATTRSERQKPRSLQNQRCPRCLAMHSLREVPSGITDNKGKTIMEIFCEECNHKYDQRLLTADTLALGIVGVPQSGKTSWMLTLYRMARNKKMPKFAARLMHVKSDRDAELMNLVRDHLDGGGYIDPTQAEAIPIPVLLQLRDADQQERSSVVINIFDYAGETFRRGLEDQDPVRLRSLSFDGLFLFLDPLDSEWTTVQEEKITDYLHDVRRVCGLDFDGKIDKPIAVCLSKVDLLRNSPLGSAAEGLISDLSETTSSETISTQLLEKRSEIIREHLPSIFPGWDVHETLAEAFQGQIMYFPMTTVGLHHDSAFVQGAAKGRAPFGVLEPLVWVLQQSGYNVYSKR